MFSYRMVSGTPVNLCVQEYTRKYTGQESLSLTLWGGDAGADLGGGSKGGPHWL